MPRVIVLVAGAEDATAVLAEAVAAGAAHIRFTEVDVRTTSSRSTNDRQIRMWGGVDELRDCDAVVFVPSLQADSNAALSEVLQTAEREPADTFLNTIFAVTGASDAAFLGSRTSAESSCRPRAARRTRLGRHTPSAGASPRWWNGCGMRGRTTTATRTSTHTITIEPTSQPSIDKFHGYRLLDDAGLYAALEKETHRLTSALAVVERPVVHVHPDERIGLRAVETSCVLHRVV